MVRVCMATECSILTRSFSFYLSDLASLTVSTFSVMADVSTGQLASITTPLPTLLPLRARPIHIICINNSSTINTTAIIRRVHYTNSKN